MFLVSLRSLARTRAHSANQVRCCAPNAVSRCIEFFGGIFEPEKVLYGVDGCRDVVGGAREVHGWTYLQSVHNVELFYFDGFLTKELEGVFY